MHILHIAQLYYPVASGAARYMREIGERLAREGHRITVLSTDAYDLEHFWAPHRRRVDQPIEEHHGVRIVRLPVRRLPGPALLYPAIRRLMTELSRLPGSTALLRRMALITPHLAGLDAFLRAHAGAPFDLIHAVNITLDFAILPVYRWARARGVPLICTPFVHLGEPGSRALVRYYSMRHQIELLQQSDRVIVQTNLEAEFLAARGVAPARMRRVGVGVTPEELQGGDGAGFRATHGITGPLVLSIGALAYDKGSIHVVEAMQRLWNQGSDATLVLIGAPLAHFSAFYERLPEQARQRIRLLAYAPDEVKRDALAAADLFVMPSRTDSFGIVYLEAWCYELPVIGARAGGVPGVIDHEHDGLLVRFGDVTGLADAIARLLRDPEQARRMGACGRAKVLRELTWEHKYRQVRGVYAEVAPQLDAAR